MIKQFRFVLSLASLLLIGNINQASGFSNTESVQIKPPAQNRSQKTTQPESGKTLYQKYCLTCHQTDGGGVPFTFPSLIKSEWVSGDKSRLIKVILNGLEGEITVGEDTFSGVMPRQNSLTDSQISTLLTWLRKNFENNSGAINPNEVKALRNEKGNTLNRQ